MYLWFVVVLHDHSEVYIHMYYCRYYSKPQLLYWSGVFCCSTTAATRMGLTAAPSLSNTLPETPAASRGWTGPSSPRCPCHHRSRPGPPTLPNLEEVLAAATAPPAPRTTHLSTSAPQMRCATAVSASPTCPHTTTTRRWRCRCPPSEAPCWGRRLEQDLLISIPTLEPSAPRCDQKQKKKKEKN